MDSSLALCIAVTALIPCALAGLALINTGLGRSRSAAHSLLSTLCVIAVSALATFAIGSALQGALDSPAHVIHIGGQIGSKAWNLAGAQPWFLRGVNLESAPASLGIWLQMLSVALAALIPLGAGADRWRLSAICLSTAIFSTLTYPVFAHWVWGGGWLAYLGVNYGVGHGFIDVGGSACIQTTGGLTALSLAWILGPRRGKYGQDGRPTAIPGHDAVLVLFGCLLAWPGWIALNAAGALFYFGSTPGAFLRIALNTTLAAASGGAAAALITRFRFGRPDASLSANGWLCGLVASGASCAFVMPAEAVIIGLVAGTLVVFSVEFLELKLYIDDPGGSISVHAGGGIWGVAAVALFAAFPGQSIHGVAGQPAGQWIAQIIGLATLLGFIFPLTYGLNRMVNRFLPQRVSTEAERQGLDLHELGAGAYPDFMTHTDDFNPRLK